MVCVIRMATDLSALGKLCPSNLQMVRDKLFLVLSILIMWNIVSVYEISRLF